MDVWNLVPGDGSANQIKEMLTGKIKLEGLRTYLFAFSAQYESLSLSQLCGMFEMSKTEAHSVVSKMIINRELQALWDQPTETIVLRKVEPSSLQVMALQFAEKAAVLVEANERLLDAQSGGTYGYKDGDWKGGDRDRDGGGGRGGGRGGHGGRGGKQFLVFLMVVFILGSLTITTHASLFRIYRPWWRRSRRRKGPWWRKRRTRAWWW